MQVCVISIFLPFRIRHVFLRTLSSQPRTNGPSLVFPNYLELVVLKDLLSYIILLWTHYATPLGSENWKGRNSGGKNGLCVRYIIKNLMIYVS